MLNSSKFLVNDTTLLYHVIHFLNFKRSTAIQNTGNSIAITATLCTRGGGKYKSNKNIFKQVIFTCSINK